MKTIEFKIKPNNSQRDTFEDWAVILKRVWNRAIAIMEWRQYYLRLQRCLEVPDPKGIFDLKPVSINCYKKGEDYILYTPIASNFRIDKNLGWEVEGNVELRQVISLIKPHWMSEPIIKGFSSIDLCKPFAQIRYPWIKEQNIPMVLVNDYVRIVVAPSWKKYQTGEANKPKYKKAKDRVKTIPSESFRGQCEINWETDRVRLPIFGWLKLKHISKRIPRDADISTFKICIRPSGYYMQLGWVNAPDRVGRNRKIKGKMVVSKSGYEDKVTNQPIPPIDPRLSRRLEREQQKLSRCKYKSNRWQKQRKKVGQVNEKIRLSRNGWQHWHSSKICDIYHDLEVTKIKEEIVSKPDPRIGEDGYTYQPNKASLVKEINKKVANLALSAFTQKIQNKFDDENFLILKQPGEDDDTKATKTKKKSKKKTNTKRKTKRKMNRAKRKVQEKLEPALAKC